MCNELSLYMRYDVRYIIYEYIYIYDIWSAWFCVCLCAPHSHSQLLEQTPHRWTWTRDSRRRSWRNISWVEVQAAGWTVDERLIIGWWKIDESYCVIKKIQYDNISQRIDTGCLPLAIYGGFLKWWYPQIIQYLSHLCRVLHKEWDSSARPGYQWWGLPKREDFQHDTYPSIIKHRQQWEIPYFNRMVNQQGIFQPDLIARYLETAYVRYSLFWLDPSGFDQEICIMSYHWFMEIWNQQRMETLGIKNIPWRFHKLEHSIGITLWNSWDSLTAFDCQGLKIFKENKLSYRLLYPYYIICLEGFGSITPDSVFY